MSKKRSHKARKIYAEYFGIEIPKDMEIHHIDEDPENDDIKNLLMLPKELHQRYHTCKNAAMPLLSGFDGLLRGYNQYHFLVLSEFSDVLGECLMWMGEKEMLGVRKWQMEGVPPVESK